MDFLQWWFDKHYILSTILTPFYTFLWAICYDLMARMVWSLVTIFTYVFVQLSLKHLAEK